MACCTPAQGLGVHERRQRSANRRVCRQLPLAFLYAKRGGVGSESPQYQTYRCYVHRVVVLGVLRVCPLGLTTRHVQGEGGRAGRKESKARVSDRMVDLMVSTVKLDADEYDAGLADLPFCFRIISPTSRLTLQAESDEDRAAWVAALQGEYNSFALCSR